MSGGSVFLIPHRLSIWSYCCFPQSETLPSHFLLLQINRTGILGCADVCRGAIVFSNSDLYMSLPDPTPVLATECSFLSQSGCLRGSSITIRNGSGLHVIPQQHPGGTAHILRPWSWTWTLSKMHVVKMIGIKQKHMVCLLQAELNTDGYFVCCDLGQWIRKTWVWVISNVKMKYERVSLCLCCSQLSCLGPPCIWCLTVTSWVVPSSAMWQCTLCSRSEAADAAGALFTLTFILNSACPSRSVFLNSYSHP